jgi:hypothetical protein
VQQLTTLLSLAVVDVMQKSPWFAIGVFFSMSQSEELQILINLRVEERGPEGVALALAKQSLVEDFFFQ